MKSRVYASRRLPGSAFQELAGHVELEVWEGQGQPDRASLLAGAGRARGLLCTLTDRVDVELLEACPSLEVISSCSVGLDHVDVAAATRRGIPVGHTPGVLAETTADLCFALLLAAARRVAEADRWVRAGSWTPERRWEPEGFLGRDVHGATLGVVGLGAIGRAVANRARGFGMRVLGWSRSERPVPGVESVPLEELLARSDFVSVHVALTPETRGLVDAAALGRMRTGAILVNTARGGIVDERALCDALHGGHLAAAALDVFAEEPLDPRSPLLDAPNLTLTPHIGSASVATRARMTALSVENLLAALDGRPMPHCANPESTAARRTDSQRPGRRGS
ncbi:MAG: D-glycerate dehydrogenase [Myxococcota bacterium]|nr:D-glycerate dehydrogenase [Myxococcota bacterium]